VKVLPTTGNTEGDRRPEEVLRRLQLTITRRLDGLLQGDYQALLPGLGSEPGDSREYQEGDDVRRMDWAVTARTTVPHVRDPVADRELESWAIVDCSASLDFGTANCEKRDLALAAVAAVGFMTTRTGNRFGALIVKPDGITRVPSRAGRQPLMAMLHKIATRERVDGGGATDLGAALTSHMVSRRRRGLAVVVSDFLSPPGWERPLTGLAARHQVLCVEVVDPRELELPNVGFLTLVDPETGRRMQVQTAKAALRQRYAEAATAQRAEIAAAIRRSGSQHLVLRTDRDWLRDIVDFVLSARRHRSGLQRVSR
jgi:uncharacterized protein (DUF58 family)